MGRVREEVKVVHTLRITENRRVFLDDTELKTCACVAVVIEAGRDPEVELRIAVNKVIIEGYTNGITDLNLPIQSNT